MSVYTFEEAFEASKVYFKDDALAADVFLNKYALRDEDGNILEKNPDDMHKRIAKEFARVESKKFKEPMTEEFIYDLIKGFKYIVPQGSPMYGIGNTFREISLSNCFVVDSPKDNYSSIVDTDKQIANISKRRGGVGVNLDNLRPTGSKVNNAARTSTGIVSWMERYSNTIREVGQNGRRGALMETISIKHPDSVNLDEGSVDFCSVKRDKTKVTGANVSIKIDDDFMNKVVTKEKYTQQWPVNTEKPVLTKEIDAEKAWNKIIDNAHNSAEPGILFWDNVLKYGVADIYEKYRSEAVNPCQPSWASILTQKGLSTIGEIKVGDKIWSESGWTTVVKKWSTGKKRVFAYRTTFGTFYGTENHRVVSDGEKIEAIDAESIDLLRGPDLPIQSFKILGDSQCIMDGLVFGDGSVHKASNNLVYLCVGEDDNDYFNDTQLKDLIIKKRDGLAKYAWEVKTNIHHSELPKTFDRKIPSRYIVGTQQEVIGFLRGLYSANGSICGGRVTLKASSFDVIKQVQLMLSSIGISSYYTTNKPSVVEFENGEYECKQSYDLNITRDINKFSYHIGFIQKYKNIKVEESLNSRKRQKYEKTPKDIVSVDEISYEEVFDITVDNESHTYWTGGLNVSNCAELTLCALDSCRLLLLNTFSFVQNPFTKDAYFDFKAFYQYSQYAQRLMDDLVDLEAECVERILAKIRKQYNEGDIELRDEIKMWEKILDLNCNGRRTGTGVTAIGDCLAALGIKYGSEESISMVEEIYKCLKLGCYRSSVDMARELGTFDAWNPELEKNNPFIEQLKNDRIHLWDSCMVDGRFIYDEMMKVGRRNVALLTTAPTGSVSILTQTTGGIEPLFMIGYKRRKKINPNDDNTRVDFVDQNGDSWQEFMVYHEKVKMWMEKTGETDISKSPWFGACANDIDWVNRVKFQGAAQKHVCHGISSTINLPNDVTKEKVSEIYIQAWKSKLKGITVYRDGCRTGVLVADKKPEISSQDAIKRPKELDCDIYYYNGMGVVVGLLGGLPYEVFLINDFKPKKQQKTGKISRIKQKHYKLTDGDETLLENAEEHCSQEQEAMARLASLSLRHNVTLDYIVTQLSKVKGSMFDSCRAICKALKNYLKDGSTIKSERCDSCGGKNVVHLEGCLTCSDCGISKCG